ncbi:MAG: VOC family protein [Pseudomonadota bacterium]
MLLGINHITLAVADLERSFSFYVELLGCRPVARWSNGAYLTAGDTWLALVVDDRIAAAARPDYSHIALGCPADQFSDHVRELEAAGCTAWSPNRSEGESYYFCDPDGHKLELHVGDLASRLRHMRAHPWDEITFF